MLKPELRLLEENREFKQCERIQRVVWGSQSISAEVMALTQKYGGVVLGAFVKGRLVGFIYAFLARRNGKIIHWSHLMALTPKFRDQGLGLHLKLAHRDLALQQGISSICWTYDPLQSRNASLNLAKLGARVEEYVVDCYGRFPSIIEGGLPSDRFVMNWRIRTREVEKRLSGKKAGAVYPLPPRINMTVINAQGFLENRKIDLDHREPRLLVEIPPDADLMRRKTLALAKRWRLETRKIFLRYLAESYQVEDFVAVNESGRKRYYYVLRRHASRRSTPPERGIGQKL
ncbi:MAG: GNAT family N-acetyltransferase [Acidobacteria bacterium]|nr:GNAT family N-acetyltransferase [Acidobacteriota bacterium]